jgi:hypothetical protein
MTGVARIVIGRGPAVDAQGGQVDDTMIVAAAADLADAAAGLNSAMVWIVDGDAEPEPGALHELLRASATPAASLPVDARGVPSEPHIGRYLDQDDKLLSAARNREVPLRHTALVSVLCERDAVVELEPPDLDRFGVYAQHEWTARLFARHPGVLVPSSRVRVSQPKRSEWLPALRMLRTPTWGRGEAIRELVRAGAGG